MGLLKKLQIKRSIRKHEKDRKFRALVALGLAAKKLDSGTIVIYVTKKEPYYKIVKDWFDKYGTDN